MFDDDDRFHWMDHVFAVITFVVIGATFWIIRLTRSLNITRRMTSGALWVIYTGYFLLLFGSLLLLWMNT